MREWVKQAIRKIEADFQRSADTHLIKVALPQLQHVQLYLKDESTHPTGSLKHRLARSLFLYGLCNGWIKQGTPIIEASSGSTAVSEAYFARLLGLPFYAVMPKSTSKAKVDQITFQGGNCHFVTGGDIYSQAQALADELNGHYMDQFTYAEQATDWRGNNNIADSIFSQMEHEDHPEPAWIVVGAGTGGTSATIGRYLRYQQLDTQLCVADPENSVFYDFFHQGDRAITTDKPSNVEGIGRPRAEPSFLPSLVDHMIKVPDAASYATLGYLEQILNRRVGGSTGTNVYAALQLLSQMEQEGEKGSVISMICDSGERYSDTYYDQQWLADRGFDLTPYEQRLAEFHRSGVLLV